MPIWGFGGALEVSTWTIASACANQIEQLIVDGLVSKVRFVFDRSIVSVHQNLKSGKVPQQILLSQFGADVFRLTHNHAKFMVWRSGSWNIVLFTSGNLNANIRSEHVSIEDNREIAEYLTAYVDEVFDKMPPGLIWGLRGNRVFKSIGAGAVEDVPEVAEDGGWGGDQDWG